MVVAAGMTESQHRNEVLEVVTADGIRERSNLAFGRAFDLVNSR